MTLIEALRKARVFLDEEREALHAGHVNPATGKVDDASVRRALEEIDELIAFFDAYLASFKKECSHV